MLAYMAKGQVMYMNDGLEESLNMVVDDNLTGVLHRLHCTVLSH